MQVSDWLTIVFSLLGVFAGAGISWVFFRTQLIADFRSLKEKLIELNVARDVNAVVFPQTSEIKATLEKISVKIDSIKSIWPQASGVSSAKIDSIYSEVKEIKGMLDVVGHLDNSKEISAIKFAVEQLDKDLNSAVREILSNVKDQQIELAERIQKTFKSQATTATDAVRSAFASEISKFVSDAADREKLLANLVRSFMEGMRVMGDYQRKNIEMETSSSIRDIEKKITRSIDNIIEEVVSLKQQLVVSNSNRK